MHSIFRTRVIDWLFQFRKLYLCECCLSFASVIFEVPASSAELCQLLAFIVNIACKVHTLEVTRRTPWCFLHIMEPSQYSKYITVDYLKILNSIMNIDIHNYIWVGPLKNYSLRPLELAAKSWPVSKFCHLSPVKLSWSRTRYFENRRSLRSPSRGPQHCRRRS